MASKPIAKRNIPCSLGTCHEDKWCPHALQAVLAADNNGAPAFQVGPIKVGSNGDGEELLTHPFEIALRQQIREEEFALRCDVALEEQDGACISSQTSY